MKNVPMSLQIFTSSWSDSLEKIWSQWNMFLTTNNVFILFSNQMALWDPSVIRASRCLFQHGQHLKDVSANLFRSRLAQFSLAAFQDTNPSQSPSSTCCLSTALLKKKKWESIPVPNLPTSFLSVSHPGRWYALCLVSPPAPNHSWKC